MNKNIHSSSFGNGYTYIWNWAQNRPRQRTVIFNLDWVDTNNSYILKALGIIRPSTKMHNVKTCFPTKQMGPTFFIALVGGGQGLNESLVVVRWPSMFGWVWSEFIGFHLQQNSQPSCFSFSRGDSWKIPITSGHYLAHILCWGKTSLSNVGV